MTYSKITQDSRMIDNDTLFVAIEGVSQDGHDYVKNALDKGAAGAVIMQSHPSASELLKLQKVRAVADTREFLAEESARLNGNPTHSLVCVGVTGTNGKTTCTYLMESILREAGLKPAVIGTVENRFEKNKIESTHTTPDAPALQKLFLDFKKMGARSIAMEVSSHALDQKRTWATRYACTLFTNLTQDHLDYHKTMDHYFQSKARLFLDYGCECNAINVDDAYGKKLADICRSRQVPVITYGSNENPDADVCYDLSSDKNGIKGSIKIRHHDFDEVVINSKLIGEFNKQNIAGAVAAAVALGLKRTAIESGIALATAVPGRLESVQNSKNFTVLVDYAHTPDALENILKTLRALVPSNGRLVCVFGCGGDRDNSKRPVMGKVASTLADKIIVTSDNPRTEDPEKIISMIWDGIKNKDTAERITDREAAVKTAVQTLKTSDILVIAGKGHEDYQIIGKTKHRFDDREIALKYLK